MQSYNCERTHLGYWYCKTPTQTFIVRAALAYEKELDRASAMIR